MTISNEISRLQQAKGAMKTAISNKGVAVTDSDKLDGYATKINDISKDATAVAGDILSGKTAYAGGSKVTGTMPSKGAATITPGTSSQTIAAGQYLSGAQTIQGSINLKPENILQGIDIFGVTGTLEPLGDDVYKGTVDFLISGTFQYKLEAGATYNITAIAAGGTGGTGGRDSRGSVNYHGGNGGRGGDGGMIRCVNYKPTSGKLLNIEITYSYIKLSNPDMGTAQCYMGGTGGYGDDALNGHEGKVGDRGKPGSATAGGVFSAYSRNDVGFPISGYGSGGAGGYNSYPLGKSGEPGKPFILRIVKS